MKNSDPCPCHSGESYIECCMKYHEGAIAKTPVELMRSRYSAYAIGLIDYIIQTTSISKQRDLIHRRAELLSFSKDTSFEGLHIIDKQDAGKEGFVTFTAMLKQDDRDVSFTEKSRFEKVEGKWYYHSGEISLD